MMERIGGDNEIKLLFSILFGNPVTKIMDFKLRVRNKQFCSFDHLFGDIATKKPNPFRR
ncbi:MAG: hypothetical protein WC251_03490 [Candidatus Izemoplasmatales bacterium]